MPDNQEQQNNIAPMPVPPDPEIISKTANEVVDPIPPVDPATSTPLPTTPDSGKAD